MFILEITLIVIGIITYYAYQRYSPKAYPHFERDNITVEEAFLQITGIDMTTHESKKDKGAVGEFQIFKKMWELFDEGYLFGNLYVPLDGKTQRTTEVDLLMVHPTGIYVFESKNYTGKVKGKERAEQWSYDTRSGTYDFYNPILQNRTHIKALANLLKLPLEDFRSYIVFGKNADVSKVKTHFVPVLTVRELEVQFDDDRKWRPRKFSKLKMFFMVVKLWKYSLAEDHVKELHIRHIKKALDRKNEYK